VQVNDSPPPAAGAPAREEARPAGEPAPERSPSGHGFRRTLERKGRHPSGRGGQESGAAAAAMAGWFRSEPPAGTVRTVAATAVAPPRAVDRVLVGAGPEGAQARIRIGAGALAGTEIQLSTADSGRAVEARLLTHTASSRQTLSVVMDEIRSRLRDRGIVLSTTGVGTRRGARPGDVDADATADRLASRTGDGVTGSGR
jgi:hypothetical protein